MWVYICIKYEYTWMQRKIIRKRKKINPDFIPFLLLTMFGKSSFIQRISLISSGRTCSKRGFSDNQPGHFCYFSFIFTSGYHSQNSLPFGCCCCHCSFSPRRSFLRITFYFSALQPTDLFISRESKEFRHNRKHLGFLGLTHTPLQAEDGISLNFILGLSHNWTLNLPSQK